MKLAKRNELRARASWPLMLVHRVLSGDREQYRNWKERLERILQTHRLGKARSPWLRRVVAHGPAWKRARGFGRMGTFVALGLASWWSLGISSFYSQVLHFGIWPYLLFLPPILPAALIAKRCLENAALASMASTRGRSPAARRRSAARAGVFHTFLAGFAGGFSLILFQGLLSWFLTPAPTLLEEIAWDLALGGQYGLITGTVTAPLGLLLGRRPVDPNALPPAPDASVALLSE